MGGGGGGILLVWGVGLGGGGGLEICQMDDPTTHVLKVFQRSQIDSKPFLSLPASLPPSLPTSSPMGMAVNEV